MNGGNNMQEITLYTLEHDFESLQAKAFLANLGLSYQEINIDENLEVVSMLFSKKVSVPFLVCGDFEITGFNEEEYRALLGN